MKTFSAKTLLAALPLLYIAQAMAGDVSSDRSPPDGGDVAVHRYLIERTFPPGALESLDADTKARVNANNATVGVRWVRSFASPDLTRTYCVYEGPSEAAIREAAVLNGLPVDRVTEIPTDLTP